MKPITVALCTALLLLNIFISSCTKNNTPEPDPTQGLTKINTLYVPGAAVKLEVYSQGTSLIAGYNKFFMALYDSVTGSRIDDAHIHLQPMMDMGTMKHAAPFEEPATSMAVNHLFPCSVVFPMSSQSGNWTLTIGVHNHLKEKEGEITIPLTVSDPSKAMVKSFTAAGDGNTYIIALVEPSKPALGINNMELVMYKKESMMSFPPETGFTVKMTPEMPAMGHGSPNNIDPVHTANGHYAGKVNFTMTGLWRINLELRKNQLETPTTQYFDIEF